MNLLKIFIFMKRNPGANRSMALRCLAHNAPAQTRRLPAFLLRLRRCLQSSLKEHSLRSAPTSSYPDFHLLPFTFLYQKNSPHLIFLETSKFINANTQNVFMSEAAIFI
jgi:hypothetical protein